MPPKRSAPPEDFAAKYIELGGVKEHLKSYYGVSRAKMNSWIEQAIDDGTGAPTKTIELADLPTGRPAEMIKERGMDASEWQVSSMTINEWEMGDDLNRQTKLTVTPIKNQVRAARPEGWIRPKITKRKSARPELSVVCGDQHAPEHDPQLHAQFLTWLDENRPAKIVMLGDLLENSDVSRWEDRDGEATAEESVEAAYYMIRDYIEASPDSELIWVAGNHDIRIEKYQNQNARKTAKVHRAGETQPVMSLPYLMRLDELGVELIGDYPLGKYKLADNLVVIHGDKAKQGAGATAIEHLKKRGYSIISGHVHRAAIVFKTTFDEDDTPSILCGVETGTMKTIKPEVFDPTPDHQNFFVTVNKWGPRDWSIEPATFAGGHLRWRDRRYG